MGAAREVIDRSLFLSPDGISFDGKRSVPSEEVTKLMLDLADLQPGEKVLEIGTGSGYQTCHLASDGRAVHTVDVQSHSEEVIQRVERHAQLKSSVTFPVWVYFHQVGSDRERFAPYDCIFVTCGMTSIPPAYEEQLREGGRLIIPLGKPDGQELLRLEKRNGKLVMGRVGGYCRFQMAI